MGPSPLTPGRPLALALLGTLAALGPGAAAVAQRVPQRAVERAIEFSTGQADNLFSVLRSQDQIHAFEQALDEIQAGEVRMGVERLHQLLLAENGGVMPAGPGRFVALRVCLVTALANLPPAAKAEYEQLVAREGGTAERFEELVEEQLLRLAERFPASKLGMRARLRLGDLALLAGDGNAAADHFRQALDASEIGSADERRIVERMHCASVLLDPAAARADRDGTSPGGSDDVLAIVSGGDDGRLWSAYGGGQSGKTPMPKPVGKLELSWASEVTAQGFDDRRDIASFPMHAVGDLDAVYINTGQRLIAFAPLKKDVAWESVTPMRDAQSSRSRSRRVEGRDGDGINNDMVLAAACNADVVVAALQVPEKSMNVDFHNGFRVMTKIPMRRLYGFERQSGKVLWSHYDELDGPRTRAFDGHDACANPLIRGDTVYCPMHDRAGAIAFSVGAYDVRTGRPKWRRLVCSSQQDVNMFGNARAEFAASPLCLHDGVLYGASNLGVAFAVEAATGRLRWIASYEVTRVPQAQFHQQAQRAIYFANNAPVVADGVVCTTPLDSPFVLGFDTESGRLLWQLPAEATVDGIDNRVTWLAGGWRDEFVLAGTGAVAVKARPGTGPGKALVRQLVRPEQLGDRRNSLLGARPALTADGVWFARSERLLGFDHTGKPLPDAPGAVARLVPGNLTFVAGIAISVRQRILEVLFDAEALRRQVETDAEAHPDDPALLLRLANLQHALANDADDTARRRVRAAYERGLEVAIRQGLPSNHPVRQALQRELFRRLRDEAEAALQRGAPDALALLAAARDVAADLDDWLQVQATVLARTVGDRTAFAAELERLLTTAPDATFPFGDGVPVRTWVTWQRARIATEPARAVELWQDLLENHGDRVLGTTTAGQLARAAIDDLIARHGAGCYAAVATRADAALRAAGDERMALAAVTVRFPNSAAAEQARVRLLDAAVRAGDLAIACGVLAQSQANGDVPPGIVRRLMVAATARGNDELARAIGERLQAHADTVSDWPDDGGKRYGELLAAQRARPAAAEAPLQPPGDSALAVRGRAPGEVQPFAAVLVPRGFAPPADVPVYVHAAGERQMRAIDEAGPGAGKNVLFQAEFDYSTHVILCGTTLILPDLHRLFAVHYRTGKLLWELPNQKQRLVESLGVNGGVLHVYTQPNSADGEGEFLGIEPLTGVVLFHRAVPALGLRPKACGDGLLQMEVQAADQASIHWLDPISGRARRTTTIPADVLQKDLQLQADSMLTRFFPQSLASDGERTFLPIDSSPAGEEPRLVALRQDGKVAWQWRGTAGAQLVMKALRGDRLVVLEAHERRPARAYVLRAATGEVLREAEAGHDAVVLNWEHTWLANPAPAAIAMESFADADRTQRQFLCIGVDDEVPTFALPLGREDGEIAREPLFGPDFVTFATRPGRGTGPGRLWCVSLRERTGLLGAGRKNRPLSELGGADVMLRLRDRVALANSQQIQILGPVSPRESKSK